MKKFLFTLCFSFILFSFSIPASAQTETVYPSIPGVLAPQEIEEKAGDEADIFPLFMRYMFYLLFVVSILVGTAVIIYGGILFILSGDDPEKKKNAKGWILGALQGAFIVLFSHQFLSMIDSRFFVFDSRELEERRDDIEKIELTWDIKNVYFQIPYGLLVEDAVLNEKGRDKFYDILDAVYDAEDTADAIVWGGKDLLDIIDVCPDGDTCCDDFPFCEWPPIPFAQLQRPKESRPDLSCWWNQRAIRSNSSAAMSAPFLETLPRDAMDLTLLDLELHKQKIRHATNALQSAMDSFFPDYLPYESSSWKAREDLKKIIQKIEALLRHQDRRTEFTIEIRKITKELENFSKKHEDLQKEPLKGAINKLIHDWEGEEALAKWEVGYRDVPFLAQSDLRWKHIRYRWTTLRHAGCLLASTTMVLQHYGADVDIFNAMDFAVRHGYQPTPLAGTTFPFVGHMASTYGFNYRRVNNPSPAHLNTMIDWLENRGPLVIGGSAPPWSSHPLAGHALVLTGADRSKGLIYVSDPDRAFMHTVTFAEARANMPWEVGYIYNGRSSLSSPDTLADKDKEIRKVLGMCGSDCPEISCAIQIKIGEIMMYMQKHDIDLYVMFYSKDLKKEDLYQLYKALMIKSLGKDHLINYPSLLLEKTYHYDAKKDITIETDTGFTKIHRFNGNRTDPYIWDWSQWLYNILYESRLDCTATEENDPATFYLEKRPETDRIIKDALDNLSYIKKQEDVQYLDTGGLIKKEDYSDLYSMQSNIFALLKEIFQSPYIKEVFAKTIEDCLEEHGIDDINSVPPAELAEILESCGLDDDSDPFDPRDIDVKTPGDFLSCGSEIPIGETFDLVWNHLIDLLFAIDGYIVEGQKLLELQSIMNALAAQCSCPCMGPCCDCDPHSCGACTLTCDKNEIESLYYGEIIPQRAKMAEVAAYLKHLTQGFFYDPTENIQSPLNEDIRDNEESGFITKHELITRKLNYSRYEFDECITRPEQLEDAQEGRRAGKAPFFGPIVEERDIPRYTKTKTSGAVVNTSDFNWFCCSDSRLEIE